MMGVDKIFNEDNISGPLKVKRTNSDESTLFHEPNQLFFSFWHVFPLYCQWLYEKTKQIY